MFHFDSSDNKIYPCLIFIFRDRTWVLFRDRTWVHGMFRFIYRSSQFDPGLARERFGV